jgi:hypothetical protein
MIFLSLTQMLRFLKSMLRLFPHFPSPLPARLCNVKQTNKHDVVVGFRTVEQYLWASCRTGSDGLVCK